MNKPLFQPIKIEELNCAQDAMDVENRERHDVGLDCTALNIDMQNDAEVRDWVLTGETWYSNSGLLSYGIEIGMRIMHARQQQALKDAYDKGFHEGHKAGRVHG